MLITIKIGCFGDYNIENSQLLKKYCVYKSISKDNEDTSVEVYYKEVSIKGLKYKLEFYIIDIEYIYITKSIIERFDSFIILSNYKDLDSIKNVQYYLEKINIYKQLKSAVMLIVAGKEAKSTSSISDLSLNKYTLKLNIPMKRCSLINQKSILHAFNNILKLQFKYTK